MKKALFTLAAIAAFVATTTAAATSVTMTTAAADNAPQDGVMATVAKIYGVAWPFVALAVLIVCIFPNLAIWWRESRKRNDMLTAFIAVVSTTVVLATADAMFGQVIIKREKITMVHVISFIGALATFFLFYIRTKDFNKQVGLQTEQLKLQIGKEIDDRFHSAIQLLGNAESSARTGAIYSLYHLATDHGKYRNQIAQILCSHIRSITEEVAYRKQNETIPSNEIQTAINLLFRDANGIAGLYTDEKISAGLPKADLSYSYLAGARFGNAKCQGAYFSRANCTEARFHDSECQGALFDNAILTGARFPHAYMHGAGFLGTQCQRVDFRGAKCQGAAFLGIKCQETDFAHAKCQGASFSITSIQGASFNSAEFHGTYVAATPTNLFSTLSERVEALSNRIGKETELNLSVDSESAMVYEALRKIGIELEKQFDIEKLIKETHGLPAGIKSGVLEDSEEIQKIIRELREIEQNQLI